LLKQGQYTPFPVEEQVVSIWLGTQGHLDDVPVEDVRRFEAEFLEYLRHQQEGILAEIADTKDLSDETVKRLLDAVDHFKRTTFATSSGVRVIKDPEAEALDAEEVGRESVRVRRPPPPPREG
jgi:F-type H+/Na+-transporting ATPase subunit alpha